MAQAAIETCLCSRASAEYFCKQCEQYFCDTCRISHMKAKVSKNHRLVEAREAKGKDFKMTDDFSDSDDWGISLDEDTFIQKKQQTMKKPEAPYGRGNRPVTDTSKGNRTVQTTGHIDLTIHDDFSDSDWDVSPDEDEYRQKKQHTMKKPAVQNVRSSFKHLTAYDVWRSPSKDVSPVFAAGSKEKTSLFDVTDYSSDEELMRDIENI